MDYLRSAVAAPFIPENNIRNILINQLVLFYSSFCLIPANQQEITGAEILVRESLACSTGDINNSR